METILEKMNDPTGMDDGLTWAWRELLGALEYHLLPALPPRDRWRTVTATAITVESEPYKGPEYFGEVSFEWLLSTQDGDFHLRGWHDYTGWDCQSGLEIVPEEYPR